MNQVLGDQRRIALTLLELGLVAILQGELDEAKPLIRKGIAMSRELMDRFGIAFGLIWLGQILCGFGMFAQAQSSLEEASAMFEGLGDIPWWELSYDFLARREMHMGQWERATASAQMGLALARESELPQGIARSFCLQSCLALAEGERGLDARGSSRPSEDSKARAAATEAQRLARQSAAILRDLRDRLVLPSALIVLGAAERTLGNLDQARQHLREALSTSAEIGASGLTMQALPAAALLLANLGKLERAVEIYVLASRDPCLANSRWFELVYGRHIEAIAGTLPPEVAEAARERGRARDLQATVKELLAEFEA